MNVARTIPAAAAAYAGTIPPQEFGRQYASDDTGQVVPGDFTAQVERSLGNLRIALAGVGLDFEHVVRLGSYIVGHDLEKLEILGTALHRAWPDRLPAQRLSGVASLALPGMLFEIDAVAVHPAEGPEA